MEKIPNEFNRQEINHKLIKRVDNVAIYDLGTSGFEVHIVRENKEKKVMMKGKEVTFKAKEVLASANEFGKYGWSVNTYERALKKMNEILLNNEKKA